MILGIAVVLSWIAGVLGQHCPNFCSGHGVCDIDNKRCECFDGWRGYTCESRTCPSAGQWVGYPSATDRVHEDEAECSNAGTCNRDTGICECDPGFTGFACQYMTCPSSGGTCSGHGRCMSLREAGREINGYSLMNNVQYTNPWDADRVRGCVCDYGWEGYDCSLRSCPRGDDPLTTGQFDEVQLLECTCPGEMCSGSLVLKFLGHSTADISALAVVPRSAEDLQVATVGKGRGESLESKLEALPVLDGVIVTLLENRSFVAPNGTEYASVCQPESSGGGALRVTFNERGGDVPTLQVFSKVRGLNADGSDAGEAVIRITTGGENGTVDGTTEWAECSNRGICDHVTGACVCFSGFSTSDGDGNLGDRGDCGAETYPVTDCPNSLERCSSRGTCDTQTVFNGSLIFINTSDPVYENTTFSYTCDCFDGYQGGDCSQKTCPMGTAWFDEPFATDRAHQRAECSNRGICDRSSGNCHCAEGFEGLACERMACPASPGVRDVSLDPCSGRGQCISLRDAAKETRSFGDRPGVPEIQEISCLVDTDAYNATNFTVLFRYHESFAIDSGAVAARVQARIEEIPTVGFVTVSFSGDEACGNETANVMRVTFTSDLGDLPQMEAFSNPPDALVLNVTTVQDGSRISYGEDPTNFLAWDADKLQMCHCDGFPDANKTTPATSASYRDLRGGTDYAGYLGTGTSRETDVGEFVGTSCALRSCPYGDDPDSSIPLGVLEIQAIKCSLNASANPDATVTVTIMEESSAPIKLSATQSQIKAALEAMPTVGLVQVSLSSNRSLDDSNSTIPTLCEPPSDLQPNGSVTQITFLTELGPRPLLRAALSKGDASALDVYRVQTGTRVPIECSARGICDRELGLCNCFSSYVSGDGARNVGRRGDCGAQDQDFLRPEDRWRFTGKRPPDFQK